MYALFVQPLNDIAVSATVNTALAAFQATEVEMVADSPDRIELRVPGELKAITASEKALALTEVGIPTETREAIAVAFRELLGNAIEHGCRLDKMKHVEVSFVRLKRAVVCRIKDPGEGFDPTHLDHAAVNNPEGDPIRHARVREEKGIRAGGYGLLLAMRLVDELVYNDQHNEVVFVKYLA